MAFEQNEYAGLKQNLTFGVVQRGTHWEKSRYKNLAKFLAYGTNNFESELEFQAALAQFSFEEKIDLAVMAWLDLAEPLGSQALRPDLSQFVRHIREPWHLGIPKFLMDYGANQLTSALELSPVVALFAGPIDNLARTYKSFSFEAQSIVGRVKLKIRTNRHNFIKADLDLEFRDTYNPDVVGIPLIEQGWYLEPRRITDVFRSNYSITFGGPDYDSIAAEVIAQATEQIQYAFTDDGKFDVNWHLHGKNLNPVDVNYFRFRTAAIQKAIRDDDLLVRVHFPRSAETSEEN